MIFIKPEYCIRDSSPFPSILLRGSQGDCRKGVFGESCALTLSRLWNFINKMGFTVATGKTILGSSVCLGRLVVVGLVGADSAGMLRNEEGTCPPMRPSFYSKIHCLFPFSHPKDLVCVSNCSIFLIPGATPSINKGGVSKMLSIKAALKISFIECFWGDVWRCDVRITWNCRSLLLGLRLPGQGCGVCDCFSCGF